MLLIIIFDLVFGGTIVDDQTVRWRQSCQAQTTGYFWNGQQCLRCKYPSCMCSSYGGCTSCIDGYFYDLSSNDCKPCPTGCQNCCQNPLLTEYICTLCNSGYRNINGVCVYMGKCSAISMHGRCLECDAGYYVDFEFVCQPCGKGCSQCSNLVYCNECQEGYQLVNTNNTLVCNICKVQGCKTCTNDSCSECLQGYMMSNNSCVACIKNCDICDTPGKCHTCNLFSVPNDDNSQCKTCSEWFPNCMKCTANFRPDETTYFSCDNCLNGYYFDTSGQCQDCKKLDSNVRRCESLQIITQCLPGYLLLTERYYNSTTETTNLLNSACILNKYGCATILDSTAQCASCLSPQILYKDKISKCIGCADQVVNCVDCYITPSPSNKFLCILCELSYYLSSDGQECKNCGDNCTVCKDEKTCTTCDDGYVVVNGVCQSCEQANCLKCSEVGQCTLCQDGYGTIEGGCLQCQYGCKSCNYNQEICLECSEDYFLYMKSCVPFPDQCLETNQDGFCYLCDTIIDYDESKNVFVDEGEAVTYKTENQSIFYKSVNGYCLKCSDYETGQFFCPDTCLSTINSFIQLLVLNALLLFI